MKRTIFKIMVITFILTQVIIIMFSLNRSLMDAKEMARLEDNAKQYYAAIDQPSLTVSQRYEASDIILIGKIDGKKEESVMSIAHENEAVDLPVVLYYLMIDEAIKGDAHTNRVTLVIPNMKDDDLALLKIGKPFKFYLEKNDFYGEDAYNLVSITNGFEELD